MIRVWFKAAEPLRSACAAREHATNGAGGSMPRGASPRLRRD